MLWRLTILAVAILFALVVLAGIFYGMADIINVPNNLNDFGTFILSAQALDHAQTPYGSGTADASGNLNPPFLLPLFQLASHWDPYVALAAWRALSILVYLACLFALTHYFPQPQSGPRLIWALALAPFWNELLNGQIYIVLLLLPLTLAWIGLRRGSGLGTGIALGLMVAIKPNFALLLALLFLSRYYRVAITAGLTALGLHLASIAIYGLSVYQAWLHALLQSDKVATPLNLSMFSGAYLLGQTNLALPLVTLALFGLALWSYRVHPPAQTILAVGIPAALFFSPVAWTGYFVLLVPHWMSTRWDRGAWITAALFTIPAHFVVYSTVLHLAIMAALIGSIVSSLMTSALPVSGIRVHSPLTTG